MEKYTVKMGCGHESTVSLSGTQKECEDTIAYLERCGLCPHFFITPSTKNPKNVVKWVEEGKNQIELFSSRRILRNSIPTSI